MLGAMRFTALLLWLALGVGSAGAAEGHSTNHPAEADLRKFQLAPGLRVELVASEPLLQNPVAFSIDGRGRFFIAETHRYRKSIFDITENTPWLLDDLSLRTVNDREAFLRRVFATNYTVLTNESELVRLVEDRDGDGRAESTSIFADSFNEPTSGTAAGVLAHGTNVWVTSIPALWHFTTGDRSRSQLAGGLGVHISVSGHDVHGLILGPDGRLYFSFGDRGVCVTNREAAVLNVPGTGGVLRCEPDGRAMEVFCTGLRNPQELAFDDLGNLWTVDNDTAGADPCRVLHLIEGGDYGWRASYQHMKGFGPWVQEELWRGGLDGVLPPAGTVSQGPAGLAFHPGTGTAPQLAGKFVHADFPGGIWAYAVKARGASYEVAAKEKVLWNCWATDVDFGPDGALYVLDWVQGWGPPGKGRIYRITGGAAQTPRSAEQVAEVKRLLGDGMARRTDKELLQWLGHADRRVRLEAQWELAARGTNSLAGLLRGALDDRRTLARVHALWALRQIMRPQPRSFGGEQLAALLPLLEDPDAEIRGQAALALGEGRLFNAEQPTAKLLDDPSPRTRLLALQAVNLRWNGEFVGNRRVSLSRIHFTDYQRAVGTAASKVEQALGVRDLSLSTKVGATITGSFPLNRVAELSPMHAGEPFWQSAVTHLLANTWTPQGAFHSWFPKAASADARLTAVLTNRRLTNAQIAPFLHDASPRVVVETARAINDAGIADAYPELAALMEDPRFRDARWGVSAVSNITTAGPFSAAARPPREQVLRRALNANFRIGHRTNAEALTRFALSAPDMVPAALRAEALFLLGAWEVLPATIGDLPIKPTKDPNHGSVPTVNPENWPGWFDRVNGQWRPLPPRDAKWAQRAVAPHISRLLDDHATEVAIGALDAAVKLGLSDAAPVLMAHLRSTNAPVAFRQRVPAAVASLAPAQLSDVVESALTDPDLSVRAAALPYLDRLNGDRSIEILGRMVSRPPRSTQELRLAQAAFAALGKATAPGADELLATALQQLATGTLPSTLELDVVEGATRRNNAALRAQLAQRTNSFQPNEALAPWRPTLAGGDAARGRTVFFDKAETQCSRCHRVKGDGGIVGPGLDGIGKRQSREHVLEAVLFPNRHLAPGFENVTVTLKNGQSVSGLIKSESELELMVDSPEDGEIVRVRKSDMTARQRQLSAMPEGLAEMLTRMELRDLIEYLASLR